MASVQRTLQLAAAAAGLYLLLGRTLLRPRTVQLWWQRTERNRRLLAMCASLHSYRGLWWLFNGHMYTVFAALVRTRPSDPLRRLVAPAREQGGAEEQAVVKREGGTGEYSDDGGLLFSRETLRLQDGAEIALDWRESGLAHRPTLILVHGLTGGSQEAYVQWMIHRAERCPAALRCVVFNARGCGGQLLRTPQGFTGRSQGRIQGAKNAH
jgi:predicted alpha/beta-fold hydrolase